MNAGLRRPPAANRVGLACAFALLLGSGCERFDVPEAGSGIYEPCCGAQGTCLPAALIAAEDAMQLGRDSCADALLCVPESAIAGAPAAAACRALGGVEGRCLPSCLPQLVAKAERLSAGTCGAAQLCAPCFDPLTGEDTGACTLGGDPGPSEPAATFARCCGELGRCVPGELVAGADRDRLAQLDCADGMQLCVPEPWLGDEAVPATSCRSLGGVEGRCLPACLPDVTAQADSLPAADCPAQHLCAPCFDPLTGEDTGACTLVSDPGPSEPAGTFARCCGEIGRCVPGELVAESDRDRLAQLDCANGASLCVPEPWLGDEPVAAASCRSLGGVEGRCLPACLPEVAEQADRLPAASCPAQHLCAPCFDPLTGEDTSACTLAGDPGPSEPATPFARCCGELGRCVPDELVAEADRDRLAQLDCADGASLCVPEPWLGDEPVAGAACRSLGGVEGRCLPACLPDVAAQADRLPAADCPAQHLCAPCFDPLTGEHTGACTLAGDPGPSEPAATFARCCGELGRCVPGELAAEADRDRLAQLDCTDGAALCVPEPWLGDEPIAPASCRALGDLEGRCLPACLPDVAATAERLRQSGCAAEHLCAPCFDPLTGDDTGACTLAGDGPSEPPKLFQECCADGSGSALGLCVPGELLSAAERAQLPDDLCSDPSLRCIPELLARSGDAVLQSCAVPRPLLPPAPGACLPACLIAPADRALLSQETCGTGSLCVRCSELDLERSGCG